MIHNIKRSFSRVYRNKPLCITSILLASVLLLLAPFYVSNSYFLHIMIVMFLNIVLASSLNLIIGYCGQVSFAHAAYYGVGAYTAALLMLKLGFSFWLALPCAALGACILGLIIGMPALRLKGDYLGIVTLGFGEIVRLVLLNSKTLTRGPAGLGGIPAPSLFGLTISGRTGFYYLVIAFAVITVIIIRRLMSSGVGLAMQAVNCDETATECAGVNPTKYKLMAFILGAAFAGMAGCFYASYITYISPDTFVYNDSITMLAMVTLGGMGTIAGPIFGAVVLTALPEVLRAISEYRMILYGLAMVLMMIFRPEGFFGASKREFNVYKRLAGGKTR